jgi:hypothetical protein
MYRTTSDKVDLISLALHIEQAVKQDKSNRFTFKDLETTQRLMREFVKLHEIRELAFHMDLREVVIMDLMGKI